MIRGYCPECRGGAFWPVTLVFVGFLLLIYNLGMLPAAMAAYWPIILVVIGLTGLTGSWNTGCYCNEKKRK